MTQFDITTVPFARIDDEEADTLDSLLAFDGRAAYLAWVAEWKSALSADVATIRSARAVYRDPERSWDDRWKGHTTRELLRVRTHNMFVLRRAARRRATAQWQAERKAA